MSNLNERKIYTYIYRSKNTTLYKFLTAVMFLLSILLIYFVIQEGISKLLSDNIVHFFVVILVVFVILFMGLCNLSSVFPIYIDSTGVKFRSFFLVKKFLKWSDVSKINIYKQHEGIFNDVTYSFHVNAVKGINSSWSVEFVENDNSEDFLWAMDCYVKEYNIEIVFTDSLTHLKVKLKELPKVLDFKS